MDWGLWIFLWLREVNAGKWAESVKVIRKVISSDPVIFRVHFLKSSIAQCIFTRCSLRHIALLKGRGICPS